MNNPLEIRPISAAQVRLLRHALLRSFEPPERIIYNRDDAPDTRHAGAFAGQSLVGIASVCVEDLPDGRDAGACWRLRGMATVPSLRHAGAGRALLEHCFAHIRQQQGRLLWCNARLVAVGFYERLGFVAEGEQFDIDPIGPHYVMTRKL